jgi:hypothetical protein
MERVRLDRSHALAAEEQLPVVPTQLMATNDPAHLHLISARAVRLCDGLGERREFNGLFVGHG